MGPNYRMYPPGAQGTKFSGHTQGLLGVQGATYTAAHSNGLLDNHRIFILRVQLQLG